MCFLSKIWLGFNGIGGAMQDKDLKVLAMQMASMLPADKATSLRVHYFLGHIIGSWLYEDCPNAKSKEESIITKLPGREDRSPR